MDGRHGHVSEREFHAAWEDDLGDAAGGERSVCGGEECVWAAGRFAGAGIRAGRAGVEAAELGRGVRLQKPRGCDSENGRILLSPGIAGEVIATGGYGSVARSRPEVDEGVEQLDEVLECEAGMQAAVALVERGLIAEEDGVAVDCDGRHLGAADAEQVGAAGLSHEVRGGLEAAGAMDAGQVGRGGEVVEDGAQSPEAIEVHGDRLASGDGGAGAGRTRGAGVEVSQWG